MEIHIILLHLSVFWVWMVLVLVVGVDGGGGGGGGGGWGGKEVCDRVKMFAHAALVVHFY